MITFKQLDAIYWVNELGSFEAAANKLHTTQSAISKRIQELEDAFGVALFDRSRRSARLTDKGLELLTLGRDLLERRDHLLERISDESVIQSHFRIGVTELTGLTWLPQLIESIRKRFPRLNIEPSIGLSSDLFGKLEQDKLDMVVVPDVFSDTRFVSQPLQNVENVWMAAHGTVAEGRELTLQEIGEFTVLTQGSHSGTGLIYERWFSQHGTRMRNSLVSDYLLAQVGLTLAGVGISYLPRQCLQFLVNRRLLQVLNTTPGLPRVQYCALYRSDRQSGLSASICELAKETCQFSQLYFDRH
ncbi:LysR family transcriptional regulator [Salinicola socius]|uniref:LysR family transcriptional regulator n=1 Tax=Salinicola socius TaxID=404433 RepID=A0A1Q8STX8_9GAMM|nr:LysR family transcriptional regulator [Salinicola socius]OLO04905.1 LysR family transcriptional regulator [Salinicola socius]